MHSSILEAIKEYSENIGEKPAVVDEKKEYSYAGLYENIKNTATKLVELNLKSGDRVVVECSQDVRFLILDFACEMAGVIFVPVEKKAVDTRVREIFTEVEAKCIIGITDYSHIGKCYTLEQVFEEKTKSVDEESEKRKSADEESEKTTLAEKMPKANDVAEILYSTGTTGKPKGIVISHKANVAVAENIMYGTEMNKNTVEIIPMPLSHSHGLRTCYANLVNGSCVVIIDGIMNVGGFFNMVDQYGVNALDISPTLGKVLIKIAKKALEKYKDKMEYIELGTAVLDDELKEQLKELFPNTRLYNFYGSTEAGRSCIYDFNKEDYSKCIGYPSRHAKFFITDENKKEIHSSKENIGMLAVSGDMLMDGYYNSPELTKKTVVNGVIYTSDLGYIDEKGRVYVFGRADDVINYKGIKISPEEIETVAADYDGIADCACVPQDDKICGQVPKLFIQLDSDEFDEKEYMSYLKENLEISRIPAKIQIIEKIPRTSNGKLQRKKLRET